MARPFENVQLCQISDNGDVSNFSDVKYRVEVKKNDHNSVVTLSSDGQVAYEFNVTPTNESCRAGKVSFMLNLSNATILMKFESENDLSRFHTLVKNLPCSNGVSKLNGALEDQSANVFDSRTEESSAVQYFQFYGYLSQQQNMMQDYIRTSTYQKAMLSNLSDFNGKVVIDVGAGSGILSFFALQSGARKVYAIEASSIAEHCEHLVKSNNFAGRVVVIPGKAEEISVPEMADILISEPMGYMLFNERMLETYLHAKKFLKPGGKMFPTQGDLYVAPFTDECLFQEQFSKAHFWYQTSFYGVDLSSLREAAITEYFRQPIVDTFDYQILLAPPVKHETDFLKCAETDLHSINIPLSFVCTQSATIHGLAFWFDVAFIGSKATVWLSTAPTEALTHWYQVRCLLRTPVFAKEGEQLSGYVKLEANNKQSYDVDILVKNSSTNVESSNRLDLKNPLFRYTGQPPQPPPGTQSQSPTEAFWNNMSAQQANGVVTTQGITSGVACMNVNTVMGAGSPQYGDYGLQYPGTAPNGVVSPQMTAIPPQPSVFYQSASQSQH